MCDHYGNTLVFSARLDDVMRDVLKGDQRTSVRGTDETHACMNV